MTKPTFFVEEDKILANLFEEGLENLHLYKPGASPMYDVFRTAADTVGRGL